MVFITHKGKILKLGNDFVKFVKKIFGLSDDNDNFLTDDNDNILIL